MEPALAGGFVFVDDGVVPWAGGSAFAPLFFSAGPLAAARVLWTSNAGVDVVEGVVGAGAAWQGRLGEARVRLGVVPALLWSHAAVAGEDDVVDAFAPAVLVPLEVGLPLGGGVSMSAYVEPLLAPSIRHVTDGGLAYGRDRVVVLLGVGLDVGGPVD